MAIDLARVADLARKLLRLIKQYGTEADLEKCDQFFTPFRNEKLYKIWRELRG